jgi:glycine/D-amino acid oxidase-like deaminating enzyme
MLDSSVSEPWRPLWRSASPRQRATLTGHVDTQFAIVGAGVEGLALAVELARRRRSVVVIEAAEIGAGATGASAGIVAPQLVRQLPQDVVQRLGQPQAERFLRLLAEAGRRTFETIGNRKSQVEAEAAGFIAPAKGPAGAHRLATTVKQWRQYRSDLQLLSEQQTRAMTGTAGYAAALLDPTGGWLNPIAYAQMLAADAEDAGAAIYLHSAVASIEATTSGWNLRTNGGTVTARQVVLCANGGNTTLSRPLRHSVLPLTVCQVATRALHPEQRRTILPHNHSMTDVETDVFSIRFDPSGRLITAYPMSDRLIGTDRLNEIINRRLLAMIPDFRPTPIEYAWSGTAWLNSDLLPRAVPLEKGLFAVQACNGRGIALSTVVGHELGRWLAADGRDDCAIPIRQPRAVRGYIVARYLPDLLLKVSLATQRLRRVLTPGRRYDGE